MTNENIDTVMEILLEDVKKFELPIVTKIKINGADAYKILVSTMLSLRTKDTTTEKATERLFQFAKTPKEMLKLSKEKIEKLIYPVGFYHTKAESLLSASKDIIEKFEGHVPDNILDLLTLKGVGRKTANLVVTEAFDKDGICVDTHVHRISNRLGYVNTKNAEKTEMALREKLPKRYWRIYNDTLVTYGQNICRPISPKCSLCRVIEYCEYGIKNKNEKNKDKIHKNMN